MHCRLQRIKRVSNRLIPVFYYIYIYIYIYISVCSYSTHLSLYLCLLIQIYLTLFTNTHTHTHTHTYTHTHIYIYISSSSCLATSPYRSSPLAGLQGLHPVSSHVCSSWSSCICSATCGGPWEYITYELVLFSPAVSCMSGSYEINYICI